MRIAVYKVKNRINVKLLVMT